MASGERVKTKSKIVPRADSKYLTYPQRRQLKSYPQPPPKSPRFRNRCRRPEEMSHQERPTAPASITTTKDERQDPQQPNNNHHNTNPRPDNLAPLATAVSSASTKNSLKYLECYENTTAQNHYIGEIPTVQDKTLRRQDPTSAHHTSKTNQMQAGFSSRENTRLPEEYNCYENTSAYRPPALDRPNVKAKLRRIQVHSFNPASTKEKSAKDGVSPDRKIRPPQKDKCYANTPIRDSTRL
jgi:hypothetical protein